MDIIFEDSKFEEDCNNERRLQRKQGQDQAKRIRRRLDDLRAADCLEDLRNGPGRLHELKGDRAEQFSLDLVHPYRLLFTVANDPIPRKEDGGLDWTQISAILILGVVDTHD